MGKKKPKFFNNFKRRAEGIYQDPEKVKKLIEKATNKSRKKKKSLTEIWEKLTTMFRLVTSWIKGDYKDVSDTALIMLIAAIIYFVSPIDAIPDFIPFTGYIDDITVIGFVADQLQDELKKFSAWESHRK